jgi:hypothetical protein
MLMNSNISHLLQIPKNGFHIPEKQLIIDPDLKKDATNFLKMHQGLSASELAQALLNKWPGYRTYTVEFLTKVFESILKTV